MVAVDGRDGVSPTGRVITIFPPGNIGENRWKVGKRFGGHEDGKTGARRLLRCRFWSVSVSVAWVVWV